MKSKARIHVEIALEDYANAVTRLVEAQRLVDANRLRLMEALDRLEQAVTE